MTTTTTASSSRHTSGWRIVGLVALLLATLAVTLHGVQSDELDVPIEDLCQPLIDKALKELGEHGEGHEPTGDDQASAQQEKGESKEEEPDDTVKDDNESHSRRKRETAPSEEVSDNKSGERSGESNGKSGEDKMETVEIITIEDESIETDSIQSIENQESAEVGAAERTSAEKTDNNEEVINASIESAEQTPVARGDGEISSESLEKESEKVPSSITPPRKERKEFDEKGRRLRYGKFTKVEELSSEERITPVDKVITKEDGAPVVTSGKPASGEKKGRMRYGKWTKSSELTSEEKYTPVGKTVATTTGSKANKDEPRLRYGRWTVVDQLDSSERHVPVSEVGKQKSSEPYKKIEKKKADVDYGEVDRKKLRYGKWTKLEELEDSKEQGVQVEDRKEVGDDTEVRKPTSDEPLPNVQLTGVDDTGRRLRYGRWTKIQELDSSERYIPVSEVTKKSVQEKRDKMEKKSAEKLESKESSTKIDISGKDETGRRLRFGRWTKIEDLDSSERYIPISEVVKRSPSEKRETIEKKNLEKSDKEPVSKESLKIDISGKDESGRRLRFGRWTKIEELDSSERYIPISEVEVSKKSAKVSTKELSDGKRIGRYGKWTKFEELESQEVKEDKSEEVAEIVERRRSEPVSRSNIQITGVDETGKRLRYGRWTKIEDLDSGELYTPISEVKVVKDSRTSDLPRGEESKRRLRYGKWTKVEELRDEDETPPESPLQPTVRSKVEARTGFDAHGKRLKYGKWTKVEELEDEKKEKIPEPEIHKEQKFERSTPMSTLNIDIAGKDETGKRLRYGRWTKIEFLDSDERYVPISEVSQREPRKSTGKSLDKSTETKKMRYGKWTLVDQLNSEERETPVGHTPAKESQPKQEDRSKLKYGKWTKLEELEPLTSGEEKIESAEDTSESEVVQQDSKERESREKSIEETSVEEPITETVISEEIEVIETISQSIEESAETISEEPLIKESIEIAIDEQGSVESDQQESVEEVIDKVETSPETGSAEREQESSEPTGVEEKSEEEVSEKGEDVETVEESAEEIIEKLTPVPKVEPEVQKRVKIEVVKKIEKKVQVKAQIPKKEIIQDERKRPMKEPARKIMKLPESDESAVPEEELTMGVEYPEEIRPRDHINELLKLDEENEEKEKAVEKVAGVILKDLKKLYETAIKPLETLYKYRDLSNRHFGDPEIFSKPLVLFMGPWSGGKSSIINYLLDIEYKHTSLRTGAEPSPAYFNILMYGDREEILDGTQLAADWTFSGLQKFGQGMLDRLKGYRMKNKLLEKVNIVEIPGILEIRKQVQRLFPFNDACQWFIDRADIIFLIYDPSKLDVGPETEAILDQLKGREYQTRIILNKADQVKPEELMRVQGALIWNISPLMSSAEPPIMYSTSLWSVPYETGAPTRLLYAQERAFLRDLRSAIEKRVDHKIASARRFAVRVRNHAKMVDCYLTTFYNHKSFFSKKQDVSDKIIDNPQDYHIYEGLSTLTNISRYDLPDPDVYRDFFHLNPLYDFPLLSSTCTYFRGCPINRLDVAIAYDLPELVGRYKKLVETAMHEDNEEEPAPPKPKPRRMSKSSSSKKSRS